ncbi:ABC-three component system protein [Actinomyces mediterranea]|uniref:ABC-three component system protein n=1 Tax=Actinomyces mediterranea TaxID=1871028 RepID=UPI001F2E8D90|nr:ABC-three component system protein [Actinomyces mediterranea]
MNILLADKTTESTSGDSRNGAGKTSFVKIMRYILGGNIADSLKVEALSDHSFWAELDFGKAAEPNRVERPVSPQTKVYVDGAVTSVDDWKHELSALLGIPDSVRRPTVGQLFGQLARYYFGDPLKTHRVESDWESGARIGFFLGFSPEILAKADKVTALEKNRKALRKAISEGAIGAITLSEPELRARLAQARKKRSRLESNLSGFRVDEQYADHQADADSLTHAIRELNDEGLSLERRKRDLELAMTEERPTVAGMELAKQLESMYAEIGIVLPGAATHRFAEVAEFHASVVRNRQMFLQAELLSVTQRLTEVKLERQALDQRRSNVMNLLNDSMALETFRNAERELTDLDALVADLERKLELVQSVSDTGLRLRAMMSEAEANVRTEIADRELPLESAIVLFQQLGEEIYNDRNVSLLIEATPRGVLKVVPKIDGDASAGILGVKTFLLDMVCTVTGIQLGRAPRILVHDSQLFDSMDDRQIASCLNIGARLADEVGFQYVVTLNSDRLAAAESEGFKRRSYIIDPVLTDAGEEGGLFGFRFI